MINKFFKFLCTGLLCAAIVCSQIPFVFAEESSAETGNWDTYSDTWALTDALGRTAADASTAGGVRGNKKVGMFYFVWHNELMEIASSVDADAPRNITQIIENNEDWLTNAGLWGPESTMHYWGEPLYGYYNLLYDDYVVRAHATQLYDAGVDYIVFDMTNFYGSGYYNESADNWTTIKNICDVYLQMLNEGNNVPKITMLTTWNPVSNGQAITYIYEKFIQIPNTAICGFVSMESRLFSAIPTTFPTRKFATFSLIALLTLLIQTRRILGSGLQRIRRALARRRAV